MSADLIGTKIDKFFLLSRIGSGGMGSVYRAHEAETDQYVAIKILPLHLAANDRLHERFMREARMAARLSHPHILPIYSYGDANGMPYIVMKLVDGGTLDSFVREGPLPLPFIARVLAQVAEALDYAHAQHVIHRDLKPENILFDPEGNVYLGDFGVAHLAEVDGDTLTGAGGFVGTVAYASPEQCRGEPLTACSDLYSLGVMVYEMLTGALPFTGPTSLAVMHQHISEAAPNPLRHRPDLPLSLADVMRKALAKLPTVRYQTASAFSAAFEDALRRELGAEAPVPAPPPGPDPKFDAPPDAYGPPPAIPDRLLADLAPTQPSQPSRPAHHAPPVRPASARPTPPPVANRPTPPTTTSTPHDAAPDNDTPPANPRPVFYIWLLSFMIFVVFLVILGVLLLR